MEAHVAMRPDSLFRLLTSVEGYKIMDSGTDNLGKGVAKVRQGAALESKLLALPTACRRRRALGTVALRWPALHGACTLLGPYLLEGSCSANHGGMFFPRPGALTKHSHSRRRLGFRQMWHEAEAGLRHRALPWEWASKILSPVSTRVQPIFPIYKADTMCSFWHPLLPLNFLLRWFLLCLPSGAVLSPGPHRPRLHQLQHHTLPVARRPSGGAHVRRGGLRPLRVRVRVMRGGCMGGKARTCTQTAAGSTYCWAGKRPWASIPPSNPEVLPQQSL